MSDLKEDSQSVVVVGASGFGRETLDVLEAMIDQGERIEILGVLDDYPSDQNLKRLADRGVTYLGKIDHWLDTKDGDAKYLLGIGSPTVRMRLVHKFEAQALKGFTAVHPTAILGVGTNPGEGVVICAGAIISTNVTLGKHVHVNPNATIGHDSVLEEYVSVNPSATISGEVLIKAGCLVGASSTILQGLTIEFNSTIGAMALVTKNVPQDVIAVGIPARWNR